MIRVLVVDDSPTIRQYLVHLLDGDPALEVVGTAADGVEAVEQAAQLRPDVIVMDVHMPRMNGFEATRLIMERVPAPIVMVSTSARTEDTAMTFDALKAGALTVLEKPAGLGHPEQAGTARHLLDTVKTMAEVKVVRRWPKRDPAPGRAAVVADAGRRIRLVAIGASTGGPQVLGDILAALPRGLPAPILIVQHISAGFTAGLAQWLAQRTPLTVKLAETGEAARAGTAYLAPEGAQMGIGPDGRIRLRAERGDDGFCPSVTHLFQSVAESYGRAAMGVLLTGMGRDGATGLRALRDAGGITVAQDKDSSVIFGMPAEAIKLGAAQYVLTPDEVIALIRAQTTAG